MPSNPEFEARQGQQAPISLELACSALTDFWSPRVVGQVNNQFIKVAKIHGEFPWHSHENEDEMFLVPRGVLHNTSATEETWIALIETTTTLHTGSEQTPMTRSIADQLRSAS